MKIVARPPHFVFTLSLPFIRSAYATGRPKRSILSRRLHLSFVTVILVQIFQIRLTSIIINKLKSSLMELNPSSQPVQQQVSNVPLPPRWTDVHFQKCVNDRHAKCKCCGTFGQLFVFCDDDCVPLNPYYGGTTLHAHSHYVSEFLSL